MTKSFWEERLSQLVYFKGKSLHRLIWFSKCVITNCRAGLSETYRSARGELEMTLDQCHSIRRYLLYHS